MFDLTLAILHHFFVFALFGAFYYWFPKFSGRMYSEAWAKVACGAVSLGFVLTFTPQFLLGNAGTQAISQTLYKQPLYNSVTEFAPVGVIAQTFFVLVTRRDLPPNTLPEFIAYAKANHAKMQFASAGAGSTSHMVCVLLNSAMGVDVMRSHAGSPTAGHLHDG